MRISIYVAVLLVLSACSSEVNKEKLKEELKRTDREFSKLSQTKGMHHAFLTYVAEDGVMLRPNRYPVEGKNRIAAMLSLRPDTGFTLIWSPMFADVSACGDLGYTYGTYKLDSRDESGKPVTVGGTYVSIWKKDEEGKWKWVLDSGNQGLGAK